MTIDEGPPIAVSVISETFLFDILRLITLSRGALGNNDLSLLRFPRTRRELATVACGEPLNLGFYHAVGNISKTISGTPCRLELWSVEIDRVRIAGKSPD